MKHAYDVCLYHKRWRFYPKGLPFGVIHAHFGTGGEKVSWDEAHSVWRQILPTRGLLQAVLFRDDTPIRMYHYLKGEGKVEEIDEPATGA